MSVESFFLHGSGLFVILVLLAVIGTADKSGGTMIEHTKGANTPLGDVTCITGKGIDFLRMSYQLMGLHTEARGMKLTRGRSCYAMVKQEYGLRGNLSNVTAQFERIVDQVKTQQTHVMRDPATGVATQL